MERNIRRAQILEKRAESLEGLGDNPFRIRTYRRVAKILENLPTDIEEAINSGYIYKIKGIGGSTIAKIEEFLKTGTIQKYEELRKKVPEELLELMEIPGVGPKTLKTGKFLDVYTEDFQPPCRVLYDFESSKKGNITAKLFRKLYKVRNGRFRLYKVPQKFI